MTSIHDLQARLQTVRSHYRVSPWIGLRDDETPLLRSWQRCRDAGMREHERVNFELVSRALLATLDDEHGALLRCVRPETERLAHAVRGTGSTVLLFNTRGVVIDRLCHEAATPAPLLHATRRGVNLAERFVGTNAPAICLAEGVPALVGRDAHFFDNVRAFFCVAAPIDAPDGQRLGVLDITSYDSVPGFDVLSLVTDAAAAVENSLFQAADDQLVLRFHPRAELLDTPMQGLLLLQADGRLAGANRMAARLLCMQRGQLIGQPVDALFDRRLPSLFGPAPRHRGGLVEMQTLAGLQVVARLEGAAAPSAAAQVLRERPAAGGGGGTLPPAVPASLRSLECEAIERTLTALGGNVSATAKALGISRNTIYRRRQTAARNA